jgi:LuxR family maltose regulon positive regulatory protein
MARRAVSSSLPMAWVSLDAGENDPMRFWRYVLTACQAFEQAPGTQTLEMWRHNPRASFETALTFFMNELAQLSQPCLLILEDYHLITSSRVHETLAFLLDYLPEMLRVFLMTRSDPPLPLARWRAHHDLMELRSADLRFSLAETTAFLQQTLTMTLDDEQIARVDERTEGWAAGLRLLTLALQEQHTQADRERILATFTGSQQHVLEYLVAEVLNAQPEPLQEFLLRTSPFGRVTASLCKALTGRRDSAQMLAHLDHANLFFYPLDGAGQWYRYHALFAEAMQQEARRRFDEEAWYDLHQQASRWYEAHNLLPEAIDTALAVQDFVRAADLMEPAMGFGNLGNDYFTLFHWLEKLPEEVLQVHPVLCLTYASAQLFLVDRYAPATRAIVEKFLQMAERVWRAENNLARLGEVETLRSMTCWWQGDFWSAIDIAARALELLPADACIWRGICLTHSGTAELFAGNLEQARPLLLAGLKENEAACNPYGARACQFILSDVNLARGELSLAAQVYLQLLAEAEACKDITDVGSAFHRLAGVSYEWNDLDAASKYLDQALAIARSASEPDLLARCILLQASLDYVRGDTARAVQELTALAARVQRWPHMLRAIYIAQARLALSCGDLVVARQQMTLATHYSDLRLFIHREEDALLEARLLIAQGQAEQALQSLGRCEEEARKRGRVRSLLEILLLQTLASAAHNDLSRQRHTLIQALMLARPEGYQRLFLNEGNALSHCLHRTLPDISDEPLANYARGLLQTLEREQTERQQTQGTLPTSEISVSIEPLSPQERRVLRLLSAGCSNPEIARELVVSVNTVKTQVQSIYHKLSVNSRLAARETALRLGLL